MLKYISLKSVGPAPSMMLEFLPRLNILTGDNGLGKTFALDIAWWALTRTWAGLQALPNHQKGIKPEIECHVIGKEGVERSFQTRYDISKQSWQLTSQSPFSDSLVVYIRIDGGISVWNSIKEPRKLRAYHFTRKQIWNGLVNTKGTTFCNGLIRDWVSWQERGDELFETLVKVLEQLSPHAEETIRPGRPMRVSVEDVRDIPTIELSYGIIPITHVSAGMQRILTIAYIMVWSWSEHKKAAEMLNQKATERMIILFDEVEAHLHPQWQRSILPALLKVVAILEPELKIQMIASTHAPLVLASLETEFCEDTDRILTFELNKKKVSVREIFWAKQGDVGGWLVSEVFGLRQPRSKESEIAIEAAEAFMRGEIKFLPVNLNTKEAIHQELQRVLAGHDMFWTRWIISMETKI